MLSYFYDHSYYTYLVIRFAGAKTGRRSKHLNAERSKAGGCDMKMVVIKNACTI